MGLTRGGTRFRRALTRTRDERRSPWWVIGVGGERDEVRVYFLFCLVGRRLR